MRHNFLLDNKDWRIFGYIKFLGKSSGDLPKTALVFLTVVKKLRICRSPTIYKI